MNDKKNSLQNKQNRRFDRDNGTKGRDFRGDYQRSNQRQMHSQGQQRQGSNISQQGTRYAGYQPASPTLPYNFVPLNDNLIEVESYPGKATGFPLNRYYSDRFTGWIDLDITNLTPIYIRDCLNHNELEEKSILERQNEETGRKQAYINPDFFSPGGQLRIPGSSLKGMIRTLVEVVTFGKFVNFDGNKKFFFRALADNSLDLRNFYNDRMSKRLNRGGNEYIGMKCSAGYLFSRDHGYYIQPAQEIMIDGQNLSIFKVDIGLINGLSLEHLHDTYSLNESIYFKYLRDLYHIHHHRNPHTGYITNVYLFYGKALAISSRAEIDSSFINGCLVCTGNVPGRKHFQHIILPPKENSSAQPIPEKIIQEYKCDPFRKGVNLIDLVDRHPEKLFPCFYIKENGNIVAFGHTPYFRLPYRHKIADFIRNGLKNDNNTIDMAEAIFGNLQAFAGRMFVEDAFPKDGSTFTGNKVPKILSGPKPTSFENYLVQNRYRQASTGYVNLDDYNFDHSQIRGYKFYWHKQNDNLANSWQESDPTLQNLEAINSRSLDEQHTIINALEPGAAFKGRIRFENLSAEELGALLFVLDLPEDCALKLGMGKPLGLGSIKIRSTLHLSDRIERYSSLSSEWLKVPAEKQDKQDKNEQEDKNNPLHPDKNQTKEIKILKQYSQVDLLKYFKSAFAQWMLKKLCIKPTNNPVNDLWNYPRLKELHALLRYDRTPASKYPSPQEYRKRHPLKKASDLNG